MKTENFCLYSIYIVVLMCLTDFLQTYLTTLHPLPSEALDERIITCSLAGGNSVMWTCSSAQLCLFQTMNQSI